MEQQHLKIIGKIISIMHLIWESVVTVLKMFSREREIFFVTLNIICNYTLPPQWHKSKSTKRYCKWNHENCQNLYQKKFQNKYYHYCHAATGQDIFFSANNNRWDQQYTESGIQILPQIYFMKQDDDLFYSDIALNRKF